MPFRAEICLLKVMRFIRFEFKTNTIERLRRNSRVNVLFVLQRRYILYCSIIPFCTHRVPVVSAVTIFPLAFSKQVKTNFITYFLS